jgi:hypothetical protein
MDQPLSHQRSAFLCCAGTKIKAPGILEVPGRCDEKGKDVV